MAPDGADSYVYVLSDRFVLLAAAIFAKARAGQAATPAEQARFASFLLLEFGRWDSAKGWTKQFHLGARRNNNTRRYRQLGTDIGFDSIGDWPQADALALYLDRLDSENATNGLVLSLPQLQRLVE